MRRRIAYCVSGTALLCIALYYVARSSDQIVHPADEKGPQRTCEMVDQAQPSDSGEQAIGHEASPSQNSDVLLERYLPVATQRLEGVGIALEPGTSRRTRPKAVMVREEGRQEWAVNLFSPFWDVVIDQGTEQILYYSNTRLRDDEYARWQEGGGVLPPAGAEARKPTITLEQAQALVRSEGVIEKLGIDLNALGVGEPVWSFNPRAARRGWHVTWQRELGGYAFRDECVWMIIHDRTRSLAYLSLLVSQEVPDVPEVAIAAEKALELARSHFGSEAPYMRSLRSDGFAVLSDVAHVEGPMFVHVNGGLNENGIPPRSLDDPVRLVHVCFLTARRERGGTCELEMWVDVESGSIVGGDAKFSGVVVTQ